MFHGYDYSKFTGGTDLERAKTMQLKDKLTSMSEEEQLMLLATHGMLVKRPMMITHDIVLVGFKEADWEGALL